MFSQTLSVARKYGAKAGVTASALVLSTVARADEAGSGVLAAVTAEITKFKADGTSIAIGMVVAVLTIGLIYKLARR